MSVSRGGWSTEILIRGDRNDHTFHRSLILYPSLWVQKHNHKNDCIGPLLNAYRVPSSTLDEEMET